MALMSPKEAAIPSTLRLIQIKILHRTYYTRVLLHKIGRASTALCLRQYGGIGTFWHILWEYPRIVAFWTYVMRTMSQVTNVHVSPDAKCCLLNIWGPTDLNNTERVWITLGMTLAKRNIAKCWAQISPRQTLDGVKIWTQQW